MTFPTTGPRLRAVGPGAVAAVVASAVVLAPWLGPGDLLVRDLVAVARPGWSTALLAPAALPREVPGEVLVALLGQVVPGGVVVRAALVVALVALGVGAARLATVGRPPAPVGHAAAVVAAVVAVWNPYVVARLQQGQWLVVVALATVPWVVVHLVDRDVGRLCRTLVLAGVSGFLAVVVVVPTLVVGGAALRRGREVVAGLVTVVVVSLPWLVVTGSVVADPDGFAAFAPSADLAAGTVPSLLAGGGHFNLAVASPWRAGWLVTSVALALTAVALWGVRRWGGGPARAALGSAALVALAAAVLAATDPGRAALVAVADAVPATAAVRDAQRLLGPWVVLLAVGAGTAAASLSARARAPLAASAVVVLLAVVALPDPLVGPRLPAPVALPDAWQQAAEAIDAGPPRLVLVVPHGRTQRYDFTEGRPVHVPLQRLVGAPVATDGRLEVEDSDGTVLVVDEQAGGAELRRLAAEWPAGVDVGALAAADVGWVAVTDPARMVAAPPGGLTVVVAASTLQLLRVDAPVATVVTPSWVLVLDLVVLLAALLAVARPWARRARGAETAPGRAGNG